MATREKPLRLQSKPFYKLAEKWIAGNPSKRLGVDALKPLVIGETFRRAFVEILRAHFDLELDLKLTSQRGTFWFRQGSSLCTFEQSYFDPDGSWKEHWKRSADEIYADFHGKWTLAWLMTKGAFAAIQEIRVDVPSDSIAQTWMSVDEPALHSFLHLIIPSETEFKMLEARKIDKSVVLPPIETLLLGCASCDEGPVPWQLFDRLLNVNAKNANVFVGCISSEQSIVALNPSIRASATEAIDYTDYSESSQLFDGISAWKTILLHTCKVAPNLRKLKFSIKPPPYNENMKAKEQRATLVRFPTELEAFVKWVRSSLLPKMPKECRFEISLDLEKNRDAKFHPKLDFDHFMDSLGFDGVGGPVGYPKVRCRDDKRFEITTWI